MVIRCVFTDNPGQNIWSSMQIPPPPFFNVVTCISYVLRHDFAWKSNIEEGGGGPIYFVQDCLRTKGRELYYNRRTIIQILQMEFIGIYPVETGKNWHLACNTAIQPHFAAI